MGLENRATALHQSTRMLILVGTLLTLLAWIVDASIDAHFHHSTLLQEIVHPQRRELVFRLILIVSQLAFIAYIATLFRRRRKLEAQLIAALGQQQEERAKSEAVLEAIGDAISIQDLELRVLYQNAAHRALMGEHRGEFCYQAYQRRDSVCPGCHVLESFRDGEIHRRETSTAHSSRGRVEVEVVSTPLRNASGEIFAGIEAVRDVTARKEAEATIRHITADLEQRTRELSAANVELEAFGSSLAHDVRSYLTRISTAAETVQALDGERLSDNGRYCIETIGRSCEGMEQLIDSIMLLSMVSHRGLERRQVDLSTLAGEIALELQAREPERDVHFLIAPGLSAAGDPGLLRIALENLIGNAWKYSREATPGRISFVAEELDGRRHFCVADNGIGFDSSESDELFRPFRRLDNGRDYPGVGIGLTTVQRIVERHGGNVTASAVPGEGAHFRFTLAD